MSHTVIGVAGWIATGDVFFAIGSVAPDLSLAYNEFQLRKHRLAFDVNRIDGVSLSAYRGAHSLWACLAMLLLAPYLGLAWALHVLLDAVTHHGSLSWMPLFPIKWQPLRIWPHQTAIEVSGGWDSVAAACSIREGEMVFFNYGQRYLRQETRAILHLIDVGWHSIIEIDAQDIEQDQVGRNFAFMLLLRQRGYRAVVVGNRGVLPFTDKWGDSNWVSLHLFGLLIGMRVIMPLVGRPKWAVLRRLQRHGVDVKALYSTESA